MAATRNTTGWAGRRAQDARAQLRSRGLPCWLCGQAIRYDLEWPDPQSFTLDHVRPRSTHPDLAYDPGNWAPAHWGCNLQRQNRAPSPGLGDTSENW